MSATIYQMFPRLDPEPRTFAVGHKKPGEETEVVELRRHCAWCSPLTDEQRRNRGVRYTSGLCGDCRDELRAGTWTPNGPEAA